MRNVIITETAKINISKLLEYLESKWNKKIMNKFTAKLYNNINLIANEPEIFPVSKYNNRIRKCVVTKQSILYYSFNEKSIVVLSLFDTRQNPEKINKIK
jgi:plasmid stabilization system protein ParE